MLHPFIPSSLPSLSFCVDVKLPRLGHYYDYYLSVLVLYVVKAG